MACEGGAAVVGAVFVVVCNTEVALMGSESAVPTAATVLDGSCTGVTTTVDVVVTVFLLRVGFTSLAGKPSNGVFSSAVIDAG